MNLILILLFIEIASRTQYISFVVEMSANNPC